MRIARRREMDLHNSLQICSLTQLLATADKCSLFWIRGADLQDTIYPKVTQSPIKMHTFYKDTLCCFFGWENLVVIFNLV